MQSDCLGEQNDDHAHPKQHCTIILLSPALHAMQFYGLG
jgi:hypothetical protein